MEKAPGNQVTSLPCGCEVHLRQRQRSSRSTSNTMTDLQRRLLAGKAGLLELALLRETQRRLIEEAVRQHRLESNSNEEQRGNSKHLRSQSTVSDSYDENRSWSAGEDSDEVFEPNVPEESRINRPIRVSPIETTRFRCLSELHCRSRTSATASPVRNNSDIYCRQRCRSEGIPDRTVHLSAAYMRPLTVSGLTYDFPSPLHAVLTQFDLTRTVPTSCGTSITSSRNVGRVPTFLGTLEMAFDEPKTPKRLNSERESFSIDEKPDSTKNEGVGTRRKPVFCRQSQVSISESEAGVSDLEGNFKENLNISVIKEGEQSKKVIGPHKNQLPNGKMAISEQFLSAEFSRSSCHRPISEESDSDSNNNSSNSSSNSSNSNKLRSQSSDDRTMGIIIEDDDSPQKTSFSGLLREEGYFSSNDSLTSIGPEPPSRKRRRGGPKPTRPLCSEASFSDSLASDSCEDNNTPRESEKGDSGQTKTRALLLSDLDADDRTPIFC